MISSSKKPASLAAQRLLAHLYAAVFRQHGRGRAPVCLPHAQFLLNWLGTCLWSADRRPAHLVSSSVSIFTGNFKPGLRRNTALACLGAAQPTGFLVSLVLGGILTDRVSWRGPFYSCRLAVTIFCLPEGSEERRVGNECT